MTAALRRGLAPLAALLGLLAAWQVIGVSFRQNYLPPLSAILPLLGGLFRSGELWPEIGWSLWRLSAGFALGLVFGVPLGLISGRVRAVDDFIKPLLALFYPIPKAALIPILMLWFGAGDFSKILIIFLSVSLPLVYHSYQGAKGVDEKLLWSAAAMGTGGAKQLITIILPAALPEILLGTRVGIVIGVIVMVSSEMIVRQNGIGSYLFNALDMAQYDLTYAVILVVSALGFGLDWLFEQVRRRLTFWAPERAQDRPREA
jgi:NitT/TauT family transport system permease protein